MTRGSASKHQFPSLNARRGLVVMAVVVVVATGSRLMVMQPMDVVVLEALGERLGIDFGDWPSFFYTGAQGDFNVFAVMAADPFGSGPSSAILSVVYRFSRLGFSFLAFLLAVGNDAWLLPAFALIGYLSLGFMGFMAGYLRELLGAKSWFLILNPALLIAFQSNTSESLGVVLLFLALTSGSVTIAVLLGSVRPSFAVGLVGRWSQVLGVVGVAVVLRVGASWRFGQPLSENPGGLFGWPFAALLGHPSIANLAIATAGMYTLIVGWRSRSVSWMGAAFFALSLGDSVVAEPINAIRAVGLLPVIWALGVHPPAKLLQLATRRHPSSGLYDERSSA